MATAAAPRPFETAGLALSIARASPSFSRAAISAALVTLRFSPSDLLLLAGMIVWALYTIKLTERPGRLSLPAFIFVGAAAGRVCSRCRCWSAKSRLRGLPSIGVTARCWAFSTSARFRRSLAMLLFALRRRSRRARAGRASSRTSFRYSRRSWRSLSSASGCTPFHAAGFVLIAGGAVAVLSAARRRCYRRGPRCAGHETDRKLIGRTPR